LTRNVTHHRQQNVYRERSEVIVSRALTARVDVVRPRILPMKGPIQPQSHWHPMTTPNHPAPMSLNWANGTLALGLMKDFNRVPAFLSLRSS